MNDNLKIEWVYDFLNRYWKYLFEPEYDIPDIDSDNSDDDVDHASDNEY